MRRFYLLLAACFITNSNISSAANPQNNSCCEYALFDGTFSIGADWLYWKVTEDKLHMGTTIEFSGGPQDPPLTLAPTYTRQDFNFRSGFRLDLGYELPCGCWDVGVCYSYIPGKANAKTFTTTDTQAFQFQPNVIEFPFFRELNSEGNFVSPTLVNSKWKLHINNVDIDLGRTICLHPSFKIRPHIGFRALWLDQQLQYIAEAATSTTPLVQHQNITMKEKLRGCGVEGGLWSEWTIGCGVSAVGHFGGSIIYAKSRLSNHGIIANGIIPLDILTEAQSCQSIHCGVPSVDYYLGLTYTACVWDLQFAIEAGWEQHVLFNINHLPRDGNIAAQGLSLGVSLAF